MTQKYNFDAETNRRDTNCYKWDNNADPDMLPMWVADMDFQVAQPITDALVQRVRHAIFGYTQVPQSFYQSIVNWHQRRYACTINPAHILYTTGVVPAVSAIIKALTKPGDEVVVLTPVYNCFFSSIRNNLCTAVEVPLARTSSSYEIDFEAFERAVSSERAKIFLLCSPHNPAGRVWTADELRRLGQICLRHNTIVVADEIHSGIILASHKFVPFASLEDELVNNSITTSSPSKSFNTAGLQVSYIFTRNDQWRSLIDRAININEICDVNPFGVIALQVAYDQCEDWLEELQHYVYENYIFLSDYVHDHSKAQVLDLQGTYLAWIDIRSYAEPSTSVYKRLLTEGHLRISPGTIYGNAGEGYLRINLATQRSRVKQGAERLCKVLNSL